MKNPEGPRAELAEVVSLDAFRQHIQPDTEPKYAFVDDPTYQAVTRVYGVINGGPPAEGFTVHQRLVTEGGHHVWIAKDEKDGEHFAIDRQRDEVEALTVDLDDYDPTHARTLEKTVNRLYCTSLVVRALFKARYPSQTYCPDIPAPRIGETELRLSADNLEQQDRWLNITRWRVAAGAGLIAVTYKRTDLRRQTTQYLQEVIQNRYEYFLAMQRAEQLFDAKLPEEEDTFSDLLIGFCNPLDRFDIKKVLDKSRADSEPDNDTDADNPNN